MEASFNAQDLRLPVFTYVIRCVDTRWRSEVKLTASNTGRSKQIRKRSQRDKAEVAAITCEHTCTQLTINPQRVARSSEDCCRKVSVQAFLVSYFLPVFPPFSATSRTKGLAARAIQDPQLLRTTADGSSGSRREARYDRPFCVYHPRELNPSLPCLSYHHDPSSPIACQQHRPDINLLSTTSPPPPRRFTHARRHKQPRRRIPTHSAL
jgi:hypothetical protein